MANEKNEVTNRNEISNNCHQQFTTKILRLSAIACNNSNSDNFDMENAVIQSELGLKALEATGGLQEMLVAQMLSVHRLQQLSAAMANEFHDMNAKQYFTNAATKLSNAFVQQAALLTRLQGNGEQKIVVQHVDIHSGGQAIVGNVNGETVKK